MSTSTRTARTSFTALALLAVATTACSSGGNADATTASGTAGDPAAPTTGDGTPKAPPVPGTPDTSDLTDDLGVFVTPTGRDTNDGTHTRPVATLQAAIALGKKLGKRVYACTGTYREALVLADSVAVIGGLDCSDPTRWKPGAAPARIEAPSSPAIRAKNITTNTRLESLDVAAPDATAPSGSSIGLLADHSPALVIAKSTITAGNGADGTAGSDGIQLTAVALASGPGRDALGEAQCVDGFTCSLSKIPAVHPWLVPDGAPGGQITCSGAPGHDGLTGGAGGTGGLWVPGLKQGQTTATWNLYSIGAEPTTGEVRSTASAAMGTNAASAAAMGTLTPDGYVPADGVAGTDGAPGNGGSGGQGSLPANTSPTGLNSSTVWRGDSGAGGGGGGCPGLAGTGGTGGGASIALALVESPVVVDASKLVARSGGAGGLGAFGSSATLGQSEGAPWGYQTSTPAHAGLPGGESGVSSNGSNGPSLGVLYTSAAPQLTNGTSSQNGAGGAAIGTRVSTTPLGTTKTVPATPAGVSAAIRPL